MQSRLERWAPLTGIGYVVLYVIGFLLLTPDSPDFAGNPKDYVPYYVDHKSDVLFGSLLLLLASFLLLWFLGSIRRASLAAEGGDGRVTGIGSTGGAVGLALFVGGIATMMVPALRLDNNYKVTLETATTFQDLGTALVALAAPIGFGALLISLAVVGIRHRALPKVWAWITAILGVVMLIPFVSWAGMLFVFPIWVLVMAILLLRAQARMPVESAA